MAKILDVEMKVKCELDEEERGREFSQCERKCFTDVRHNMNCEESKTVYRRIFVRFDKLALVAQRLFFFKNPEVLNLSECFKLGSIQTKLLVVFL